MKNLIAAVIVGAILLVMGCTSLPGPGSDECARAEAVYTAYILSLEFREPTEDEVIAARIAAALLTAQCGWSEIPTRALDAHGVPILTPE